MSFFDNVVGALGGQATVIADVEKLANHLGNGGLTDIVNKLQSGNLGAVVQSWIGNGANLPVTTEQLQSALGPQHIEQLTSALGVSASQLPNVLPQLINHLTPSGILPAGGISDLVSHAVNSGVLNNVLGGLLK